MSGAETTAPAPSPAPAPAAATSAPPPAPAHEAVVDQKPVHTPAPVGSQAPPAEAKIGHNRPPEPIDDKEKPARRAEPPIDLRKPPPPERGERGRFVARDRQQAQ